MGSHRSKLESPPPPPPVPETIQEVESPPVPPSVSVSEVPPSEAFFQQFANPSQTEIEPEGLERLCMELGIDPATDVEVLVLAWKCHTRTMGTFTKEEFLSGIQELSIDSVSTLKKKIPELRAIALDTSSTQFKDFYRFVFEISREPGMKVVDVDVASALVEMLLGPSFAYAQQFKTFLGTKLMLQALSVDQWLSFLEFCKQHSKGLKDYDSDGAWPVLIDEFVAWLGFEAN